MGIKAEELLEWRLLVATDGPINKVDDSSAMSRGEASVTIHRSAASRCPSPGAQSLKQGRLLSHVALMPVCATVGML